jgi:hypothetical protein
MLPQWPPWQTEENIIYCSQASWLVEDDNQKKREREREREREMLVGDKTKLNFPGSRRVRRRNYD